MDGFVLAGGASTRMGVDKARAPFGGAPMAVAAARSLAAICERVVLVRRSDDGLPWPRGDGTEVPFTVEPPHEASPHPLLGVAWALRRATTRWVAVVPCDVPGVSETSWRALLAAAPAVAVGPEGEHPLVAVLSAADADRAWSLAVDHRGARALVDGFARVRLPAGELSDHNLPADLGRTPLQALEAAFADLPGRELQRLLAGERGRQRARGVLDPGGGGGLSSPSPEAP